MIYHMTNQVPEGVVLREGVERENEKIPKSNKNDISNRVFKNNLMVSFPNETPLTYQVQKRVHPNRNLSHTCTSNLAKLTHGFHNFIINYTKDLYA